MKKMMFAVLMVSAFATAAFADNVSVTKTENGKTVTLNGGAGGVSQEIFTIMDKAGVQAHQYVEGKVLDGKNITSSVFFLNGSRSNVTFTVDSASSEELTSNGKTLTLSGDVAEELLNDMAKSGATRRIFMDGPQYVSKNVLCSDLQNRAGNTQVICTITVQ